VSLQRLGAGVLLIGVVLWLVSPAIPDSGADGGIVLREPGTITITGKPGSFGPSRATVPSGQRLGRAEVPQWDFPAGRKPHRTIVAPDGTVFMAATAYNDIIDRPAPGDAAIGTYDPAAGTSGVIRLPGPAGATAAPVITDLVAVPGAVQAVAFTAWTAGLGAWPAFGVLTKVDGHWRAYPENLWPADKLGLHHPLRIARLPGSGHLVVAQDKGLLTPLRLGGPDAQGRFTATAAKSYSAGGDVTVRELSPDPTGKAGQERVVASMDKAGALSVIQEFGYDAATGDLRPISAAMVPGDRTEFHTYEYRMALYDRSGTLWAARREGIAGDRSGGLAVYTKPRCRPAGTKWAHPCPPQYTVVQARDLPQPVGLVEDPATGTVVLHARGGTLLSVRVTRWDPAPVFQVGNLVDLGSKLLASSANATIDSRFGTVDAGGRLWLPVSQVRVAGDAVAHVDHWLLAVNLPELFAPPPVRIPSAPGRWVTIQAEATATIATNTMPNGDVISAAHFRECITVTVSAACSDDGTPGEGFILTDHTGYGHMRGSVGYRIDVPVAGEYRLSYRVGTFGASVGAKIELIAGDRRYLTPVSTLGDFRPILAGEVVRLDAGVQTIVLSPPQGAEGWFLNSMTLQRV
jgi:hypothetical protein